MTTDLAAVGIGSLAANLAPLLAEAGIGALAGAATATLVGAEFFANILGALTGALATTFAAGLATPFAGVAFAAILAMGGLANAVLVPTAAIFFAGVGLLVDLATIVGLELATGFDFGGIL